MSDVKRFKLIRHEDISGISGIGHIADGVCWPDGSCTIRWRGKYPSVVYWQSIEEAEQIHGHNGCTTIEWVDK